MKRKVYIETSVISYLTARPSKTIVGAAHQQITLGGGSNGLNMNFLSSGRSGKNVLLAIQMPPETGLLHLKEWLYSR
jgi:hypothetical protein